MAVENDFGEIVKFEVGDKVKIWKVYPNPDGTIEAVRIDPDKKPIFYLVRYFYPRNNKFYTEEFESSDLTLIMKYKSGYSMVCECGSDKTGSSLHSPWCKKASLAGNKW